MLYSEYGRLTLTLLPELWLAFLDCGHDHVTHSSRRQTVQTALDALHRDDVKVLGTWRRGEKTNIRKGPQREKVS